MDNPLQDLSPALLSKLASIAVHAAEGRSTKGHHFDAVALSQLLDDPQVRSWLKDMSAIALAPRTRSGDYP